MFVGVPFFSLVMDVVFGIVLFGVRERERERERERRLGGYVCVCLCE